MPAMAAAFGVLKRARVRAAFSGIAWESNDLRTCAGARGESESDIKKLDRIDPIGAG